MLFEVSLDYDKSDAIALIRAVKARRFGKVYRMVCRLIRILFGIWFFRAGLTGLTAPLNGLVLDGIAAYCTILIPALFLLVLGVYLLFRGVFNRTPLSEWQARKSFHLHRKDEVFRFAETHYELCLGNSFHSIDYSNIEAIVEDKKHYFLFINKNSAHVLNKEKFVVGSADDFGAFISGKTGVTIKTV